MDNLTDREAMDVQERLQDVLGLLTEAQACAEIKEREQVLHKLDGIASIAHEAWEALLPEPVPEDLGDSRYGDAGTAQRLAEVRVR